MYLDLGTGSLIIQFLIGLVVALPVLAGVYWKKIRNFVRRGRGNKNT